MSGRRSIRQPVYIRRYSYTGKRAPFVSKVRRIPTPVVVVGESAQRPGPTRYQQTLTRYGPDPNKITKKQLTSSPRTKKGKAAKAAKLNKLTKAQLIAKLC